MISLFANLFLFYYLTGLTYIICYVFDNRENWNNYVVRNENFLNKFIIAPLLLIAFAFVYPLIVYKAFKNQA